MKISKRKIQRERTFIRKIDFGYLKFGYISYPCKHDVLFEKVKHRTKWGKRYNL